MRKNVGFQKGEKYMNKKLILAAMAVILAAGSAQATNVTGATGGNGVYSVKPEKFSGIAGYRKYDNFTVTKGDKLNMEFVRPGDKTQPTAFVNLVGKNGVNINGIVNTTRNGSFYNGHAIFITPGGFVVGQSGVLNVGRLSVSTPTASKYNDLTSKYAKDDVYSIGQEVSALTQNSKGNAGAADITINGKVFARSGVEMAGKTVAVPGNIVNGVKEAKVISSTDAADALFSSLVNTDGTVKAASLFQNQGGRILIKSAEGLGVSGTVTNGTGATYLTNNGSNGMVVTGKVAGKDLARLYNTKGALTVGNNSNVTASEAYIRNKGAEMTFTKDSKVDALDVTIMNDGSGKLVASGRIDGNGQVAVKNTSAAGMQLSGTLVNANGETAINNTKGEMLIDGVVANRNGNMGIINYGSGAVITKNAKIDNNGKLKIANTGANGLTFVGDVKNDGEIRIYNDNGKLTFGTDSTGAKAAQINNKNGKLYIAARKDATGISQSTASNIVNENGNLVIRNSGTKVAAGQRGMDLQGGVKATNGTVSINNDFGDMYVSSNVEVSKGNLGIINRANGADMTLAQAGNVNVKGGNINIKNYGKGDMVVNSTISHDGRVNVLANRGSLTLGSTVHNNSGKLSDNGGFYAAARKNGTGVNVTSTFAVDGNGEVLIKNISGADGLRYAGTINTTGHQAALVNHKGNMNVSGAIATKNAPIVVSNKGAKLTVVSDANLNSGTVGNLYDNGSEEASISSKATLTNMEGHGKLKGKI